MSVVFSNSDMQLHIFSMVKSVWICTFSFLRILTFPDLLLYVCVCSCVCSCVHLSALEVAALALLRSTESARRSHGRLSGADS